MCPKGEILVSFKAMNFRHRRSTLIVVRRSLESAGVDFIDENGGGVGVRFREARREKPRE
jgi:hypothetical protein